SHWVRQGFLAASRPPLMFQTWALLPEPSLQGIAWRAGRFGTAAPAGTARVATAAAVSSTAVKGRRGFTARVLLVARGGSSFAHFFAATCALSRSGTLRSRCP